ncbi:hypothetical protein B1H18_13115 [Streptomyces tsukubensis]|uniref:DUF3152 domain-containing protein n=1 Tax=Streptomyces tsukubensis TaxID=83656 RepID=A0A1V4A9G1_9ACTN|nr:hypothetical protein B1H18_13115 [Streptomyces tsukubensis]
MGNSTPSAQEEGPTSHRARRRSPGPRGRLLGLVALGGATALVLMVVYGHGDTAESAAEPGAGETGVTRQPAHVPATEETDTAPSKSAHHPTPSPTPTPTPSPSSSLDIAQAGTGTFTTATASGDASGKGTVRRYKVEVEGGTGLSANAAAQEIHTVLADRRGWTTDGRNGFQLVSSGPYDFEVKIATPDTVDRLCGAAGLHTHGEVNCDVGDQVIVNLKRWQTGSPEFSGPLHEYRALIINHEVGHRIGHGHETCPGPGLPAPAMMQQIDGLRGCRANAWPYDSSGTYLGGPKVP